MQLPCAFVTAHLYSCVGCETRNAAWERRGARGTGRGVRAARPRRGAERGAARPVGAEPGRTGSPAPARVLCFLPSALNAEARTPAWLSAVSPRVLNSRALAPPVPCLALLP